MIATILATGAVVLILALAIGYIIKAKKKGVKCIGCPAAGNCTSCESHAYEYEDAIRQAIEEQKKAC